MWRTCSSACLSSSVARCELWLWLRREQQTGTLEVLYLAPTSKGLILAGVALYGTLRNLVNFGLAFSTGCLIFGVNPFQGDILLALVFLLLGLIPLYGISLLYGAIILMLKEANAMIQLAQWSLSFLWASFSRGRLPAAPAPYPCYSRQPDEQRGARLPARGVVLPDLVPRPGGTGGFVPRRRWGIAFLRTEAGSANQVSDSSESD
jgi:hypothetical protein